MPKNEIKIKSYISINYLLKNFIIFSLIYPILSKFSIDLTVEPKNGQGEYR